MKRKNVKHRWAERDSLSSVFRILLWKGDEFMAQVAIRLSDQEKEALAEHASANDLTISQIIRKLIREYLGGLDNGRRIGI